VANELADQLPSGRTAPPMPLTSAHVLVCVDGRCAARGAEVLHARLWDDLEQEKLAYYRSGGSIRLTASSCLGSCDFGPTVAVYADRGEAGWSGTWHHEMDEASTMTLLRELHRRGDESDQAT
jgi:(2Fe-2S) ferredoxin